MFIEAELYMQKIRKKNQSWENDVTERRADGPMKTNSNSTLGIHKSVKKKKKKKSTEINKEYEIFCYFKDWSIKETKMWIMGLMQ